MMQLSLHDVVKVVIEQTELYSPQTSDFFRAKVIVHMKDGGEFDVTLFASERTKPIPVEQLAPEYLASEC